MSGEERSAHGDNNFSSCVSSWPLQMVPWNPEPLRGRKPTDAVQRELLPGEEQPDLPQRLLALTQVDAPVLTHTWTYSIYFPVVACQCKICIYF